VALASAADEQVSIAATDATAAAPKPSRWRLGVAFGYGLRSNPLVQSDDIPIVVDIDVAWFGDRFFFDNGDIGLTVIDNSRLTADVVARVNSDRVFFGKTNTKFVSIGASGEPLSMAVNVTVPDRDYALEIGFEVLANGDWGRLQLAAYHDVSGTHDGYEIDFDYGFGWRDQRWYLEPSFGLTYKSDALNDYFWGVRAIESNEALPAYTAKSGINAHARLLFSYQIDRNWVFTLAGEFERLNDDAAASPLVADANVLGYFIGFGYRF
jgi:outer membrane protein